MFLLLEHQRAASQILDAGIHAENCAPVPNLIRFSVPHAGRPAGRIMVSNPIRRSFVVLACGLLFFLSACSTQNSAPPTPPVAGTGSPSPVSPTDQPSVTTTPVPPTLTEVRFAYTDDNTAEVNVVAGVTIQSPFETVSSTSREGVLRLPVAAITSYPVFLKDTAGNIKAITEYTPGDARVTFSALETSRALVQETFLLKANSRATKVLVKSVLDSGTYDNLLSGLTASTLSGQATAVDSDANFEVAYNVAFQILNDLASGQIRPQTILKNVRDEAGIDLPAQLNLDVTEQKSGDEFDTTTMFTLLNTGPVTYGVRIAADDGKGGVEAKYDHMTLTSTSGFTGQAFFDYLIGLIGNKSVVELSAKDYPKCRPLTITYAATESEFTYSGDRDHKFDLSPLAYNAVTIFSAVADIANIPVEQNIISNSRLIKYGNTVAAIVARTTASSGLSGTTEDTQPLQKLTFFLGLIRDIIPATYDLLKEAYPEGSRDFLDAYSKTNNGLSAKLSKAFIKWRKVIEEELNSDPGREPGLVKILNGLTSVAKVGTIGTEMARELYGPLYRTSRIQFNPCAPVLKLTAPASITGKVGNVARGDILIQNMKLDSILKFAAIVSAPSSVVLEPASGTVVNDLISTRETLMHLSAPCTTTGSKTEDIIINSNDKENPTLSITLTVNCVEGPVLSVPPTVKIEAPVGRTAEKTFVIRNIGIGTLKYSITGDGFEQIKSRVGSVSAENTAGDLVTLLYTCKSVESKTLTLLVSSDVESYTEKLPVNVKITCASSFPFSKTNTYLTIVNPERGGGGGYTDGTYTVRICTAFSKYTATLEIDAALDKTEPNFVTYGDRTNIVDLAPLDVYITHTGADGDKCDAERVVLVNNWVAKTKASALSMYMNRLILGFTATDIGGVSAGDGGSLYQVEVVTNR